MNGNRIRIDATDGEHGRHYIILGNRIRRRLTVIEELADILP